MQDIITFTILVAVITFGLYKIKKSFKKPIECNDCGNSCEGCPINKKTEL